MTNPLADFYRNKEIYIRLPSQGKWYKSHINLTSNGEVGIKPMTIQDEMLINIPDSLYNGESLFELFKSVVPDITDPYEITLPDSEIIIIASKAATYENKLSLSSTCTHCEKNNVYEINLPSVLKNVAVNNESIEIEIDQLLFKLKPNTLKTVNASSIEIIENERMLRMMSKQEQQDSEMFRQSLAKSTAAGLAVVADLIESITTPDGTEVTEIEHILDYIKNTNSRTVNAIKKEGEKLNRSGIDNEFTFTCPEPECGKEFSNRVEFNPAFFLDPASVEQNRQQRLKDLQESLTNTEKVSENP